MKFSFGTSCNMFWSTLICKKKKKETDCLLQLEIGKILIIEVKNKIISICNLNF